MNYPSLLKRSAEHAALYYIEHPDERLVYHNQQHAKQVVDKVQQIAAHYHLNERDEFIVTSAAWFHDMAILTSGLELHEQKSAVQAETFLQTLHVPAEDIAAVRQAILATTIPQNPVSVIDQILCDADLFHLGTDSFKENYRLVRKELEALNGTKMGAEEWRLSSIALLENHSYHTAYCKGILDATKAENLSNLKRRQEEKLLKKQAAETEAAEAFSAESATPEQASATAAEPAKSKKTEKPVRGVETMFRVSSSNHLRLSVMADNKAHIMITVNSIIVSVGTGVILGKFGQTPELLIPSILLLTVNVITIIYAILATRPRIPEGTFTLEQVERKTVNLLFFGSFYKMGLNEFEYGMRQMMNDSDFLYGSLIKDIYWQGKVLGRKFRLLRIAYDVFMYGIIASVIAFILAEIFYKP